MTRTRRALALLALLGAAALARTSRAAPPVDDPPNVTFKARVEPASVAPGGRGEVVFSLAIRPTFHVFADKRLKVMPVDAAGVTYGEAVLVSPTKWKDPTDKDAEEETVWFGKAEVRLPFTLAANATLPVRVGANLRWSGCDENQCWPPESTKEPVVVQVATSVPAVVSPSPTGAGTPSAPPGSPDGTTPPPAMSGGTSAPAAPAPGSPAAPAAERKVEFEDDEHVASVVVRVLPTEVRVSFEPKPGFHLYASGSPVGDPIRVEGKTTVGVTWKPAVFPARDGYEVEDAYEVVVPYVGGPAGGLLLHWQGCDTQGCRRAADRTVDFDAERVWAEEAPAAAPTPVATAGSYMYAEYHEEAASTCAATFPPLKPHEPGLGGSSDVDDDEGGTGIALLLTAFLFGIGLAFTPCVLPIIPITISIIGGGGGTVSRGRLTLLLSCYVAGLSLSFGAMGLAAAKAGTSFSAAFQSEPAVWAIAGLFFVLSLGMYGIFELQPPAWLQRLQGGAKGGSVLGTFFFGALAAVIASPCTGPVIAGMVVYAAREGNLLMGFFRFVALGLGMGAVFFAAGSLNLVMRPGPWMVWVRHGFGVIMTAAALYYAASAELLSPVGVFAAGFGAAILIGFAILRHLVKAQGQSVGPAAKQGAGVAVAVCLATGLVAILTRPSNELTWTVVRTRDEVAAQVEAARKEGKGVVVDVWATWCAYCKQYDRVIEGDPACLAAFRGLKRLRLDVTRSNRDDLRYALRIPNQQPYMVFVDREGRQRGDLVVPGAHLTAEALRQRAECLAKPAGTPYLPAAK